MLAFVKFVIFSGLMGDVGTVNPEIFARTLFSRIALKDIFATSKFVTIA